MNKKLNSRGAMALSQIFILVIGIIAISYALGSNLGFVSADEEYVECEDGTQIRLGLSDDETSWKYQEMYGLKNNLLCLSGKGKNDKGEKKDCNENSVVLDIKEFCAQYSSEIQLIPEQGSCIGKEFMCKVRETKTTTTDEVDTQTTTNPNIACELSCESIGYYEEAKCGPKNLQDTGWIKNVAQVCPNTETPICWCRETNERNPQNTPSSTNTLTSFSSYLTSMLGTSPFERIASTIINNDVFVAIGPAEDVAIWKKIDEEKWECLINCVVKGNSARGLCPKKGDVEDCTGEKKNLCTHYKPEYISREGYTNPPGNCEAGYFRLNSDPSRVPRTSDGDGDGIPDAIDPFPEDSTNEQEEIDDSDKIENCINKGGKCRTSCDSGEKENSKGICETSGEKCCVSYEKREYFDGLFNVKKWGFLDWILKSFTWSVAVYSAVQFAGESTGLDENLVDSAALALSLGTLAMTTTQFLTKSDELEVLEIGIGVGVALGLFIFVLYRHPTREIITFDCRPWAPPLGGSRCDECNNNGILPCSEYQCKSLGQACELENKGTGQEKCVWVNRTDVSAPVIEPWLDALINEEYIYTPDNAISPPDYGVSVQYTSSTTGCLKAFTPLSFGITLDEPARCKLDVLRKKDFEDMDFFFSSGLFLKEHDYTLKLPSAEEEGAEIENDGEYSIYVRCQDFNGNSNTANFVFNFCVDKGPDTTPPLIVQTSIPNGMPIAFNQNSVNLEVYINEPVADCKWSHIEQDYGSMIGEMNCARGDSLEDINNVGYYTCETTLDSLKDREENKFYMRCEDLSGNINEESYELSIMGTAPLVIDWIKPENDTIIKDSTEAVKVTLEARTSVGYDEGASNCYYSDTGDADDYVLFLGDGDYSNYEHSQDLWPAEGEHEYFIKCVDLGGNDAIGIIHFEVQTDEEPPIVVRVSHEETYLKIITDEAANCVYDTKFENYPCDYYFEDGTPMTTVGDTNHYTDWNTQTTFYIKCQDEYGSQPAPDTCSAIVRPSNLR